MKRLPWLALPFCLAASGVLAQAPQTQPFAPPPIEIADPGPGGARIDQDGVFANFYPGQGAGKRPGILLLAGSEGGLGSGTIRMAQALALEGFGVLQLCYFGCPGEPQLLANVPLETFSRGLAWLRARPDIDGARLAVVGGSKGAEAALQVAAREPGIAAVIATQPTSVVWPGIAYSAVMKPGWTANGVPVPFLPYAGTTIGPGGLFARYNDALPALSEHEDAIIPVERITAPILLVCGEADTLWPSCPMTDRIVARLAANNRPAPAVLRYPDAGHEVFGLPIDSNSPFYNHLGSLGGSPAGIAAAHADAWPKTVAFLKRVLR